jgi:hypothetical protein
LDLEIVRTAGMLAVSRLLTAVAAVRVSVVRWASTGSAPAAGASATHVAPPVAPPDAPQVGLIGVEPVRGLRKPPKAPTAEDKCGDPVADPDDDAADMVPMIDPATGEWNGPTRGGINPEPTRFGDWERKGRCTDFS